MFGNLFHDYKVNFIIALLNYFLIDVINISICYFLLKIKKWHNCLALLFTVPHQKTIHYQPSVLFIVYRSAACNILYPVQAITPVLAGSDGSSGPPELLVICYISYWWLVAVRKHFSLKSSWTLECEAEEEGWR